MSQSLEQKAIGILRNGYIPQDHKNLLTWASITALFVISTAAAFVLGYQLATMSIDNNLKMLQDYSNLEHHIINQYEHEPDNNPQTTAYPTKKFSYLDQHGNLVPIN